MTKEPSLQQRWKEFQLDRVQRIQEWNQEHYKHSRIEDPLIRYIVLWSVFNALYNTFDLPSNRPPDMVNGRYKFRNKFGYRIPNIGTTGDTDRVKKIAKELASLDGFFTMLNQKEIKHHIQVFIDRIPTIAQDEGIDVNRAIPINYYESGQWIEEEFVPAEIRGIASLDRRLFLTDGYKFFEYSSIDNPWDVNGKPIDILLSTQQLLSVLYQLRNNTVHGGSTAYHTKEIILDGQPILEAIIKFIFNHREEIFTGE